MIHKVYTVYDSKVEAYLRPFFIPSDGAAIRAMIDCLRDPGHAFAAHPGDYSLFYVGEWDDASAEFYPAITRLNLGLLSDLHKTQVADAKEGEER